jgi:hypothetical protein
MTINVIGDGLRGTPLPQPDANGILDLTPAQAGMFEGHPVIQPRPSHHNTILSLNPYGYLPLGDYSVWDQKLDLQFVQTGSAMTFQSPSILPSGEGFSLNFNGLSNNYFTAPNTVAYDLGYVTEWAWSGWYKQNVPPTGQLFAVSKRATTVSGTDGGYDMLFTLAAGVNTRRYVTNGGNAATDHGGTLTKTGAHHFVVNYYFNGSQFQMDIWTDGVMVNSITATLAITPSSNALRLGAPGNAGGSAWNGALQSLAMWYRRLTTAEIQLLWRSGQ